VTGSVDNDRIEIQPQNARTGTEEVSRLTSDAARRSERAGGEGVRRGDVIAQRPAKEGDLTSGRGATTVSAMKPSKMPLKGWSGAVTVFSKLFSDERYSLPGTMPVGTPTPLI
jgi:hypothetical protein